MKIFLILLAFNIYSTRTTPGVDAQLYVGCEADNATGTTVETCFVNRRSPLAYTATDGTVITLGTLSVLAVLCVNNVPGTLENCACAIVVDPVNSTVETDICSSCTISNISDTTFENYFDCSNRLNGTCVGLTATGECISNIDPAPVTPAPVPVAIPSPVAVPVTTTLAPRPIPTSFPVFRPTVTAVPELNPINTSTVLTTPSNTPAGVTSNDQNEGTGDLNVGVVTAIGVVGGMALSALVAYLLVINKRKQTGKANDLRQEPTVRKEIHGSKVDFEGPSSQSNGNLAQSPALVQNPIVETPPNNVYDVDDYDEPDKRNVYTAIPDIPKRYSATTAIQTPATASLRPSYPVNPDLHVKDQCRVVPPVVVSSPIFVSGGENSNVIPFAVAVGVASSTISAPVFTETNNNNETQPRRTLLEP